MSRLRGIGSPRLWGAAGTVVVHGVILALLLLLVMDFNARRNELLEELAQQQEQQEDDPELLLAGEYVTLGDDLFAEATTPAETAPPSDAADMKASADAMLTTTAPSEIKAAPRRQEANDAESRIRARERQAEQQRMQQAAAISDRVKFGSPGDDNPSDRRPGSVDGNKTSGASLSGRPGASLKGRTLSHWDSPSATASGTIVVSVRVDRKGRVISATYSHGSGGVASDLSARRSCVSAAMKSVFSVSDDAPAEQTGTITYRFVPPTSAK